MLKTDSLQQETKLKHSWQVKVVGGIVIASEVVMIMLLCSLHFFFVFATATEAKTLLDCALVGLFATWIPALTKLSGFSQAVSEDVQLFKKGW